MDINVVHEALKVNLAKKMHRITKRFIEKEVSKKDFINSVYAQDIFEVSNEHIRYISFFQFLKKINSGDIKCQNLKKHLIKFCVLYGLWNLHRDSKGCFETGYFHSGADFGDLILGAIKLVNKEIRPYALSIIESFGLPDHMLQSAIGNSYGDIYETHL